MTHRNFRNPPWARDEIILATEIYLRHGGQVLGPDHPDVLELSELLNILPIHEQALRRERFRNANGVGLKLANIRFRDPNRPGGSPHGSRLDGLLWEEFDGDESRLRKTAAAIRRSYALADTRPSAIEEIEGRYDPPEGRILMRLHSARERNPVIIERKIEAVKKEGRDLGCSVCGFDFEQAYGAIGRDFVECHLDLPLDEKKLTGRTSLADLAIVCANCHRMLHRDGVRTTSQLRAMLPE